MINMLIMDKTWAKVGLIQYTDRLGQGGGEERYFCNVVWPDSG